MGKPLDGETPILTVSGFKLLKDIKVDLATKPEIKETVDAKSGYLVIKIIK